MSDNVYYVKYIIRRLRSLFQALLSPVPALALLLLIVLAPLPAKANDTTDPHAWTSTDTALELSYQALRVIDWRQTVYITQHQPQFGEANSTLSSNLTHGNVNRYMAFLAVGHAAVSYILPGAARTVWQSLTIVEVGAAVHHNDRIGIGFTLHF